MSTSATTRRRVAGLCATAAVCVIVANVYALFGHGVRSAAMDFMFLYPLGGAAVLALMRLARGKHARRLGANLLNSGVATLTVGAMFRGILEIAGGSSGYVMVFPAVGWTLATAGVVASLCTVHRVRRASFHAAFMEHAHGFHPDVTPADYTDFRTKRNGGKTK